MFQHKVFKRLNSHLTICKRNNYICIKPDTNQTYKRVMGKVKQDKG